MQKISGQETVAAAGNSPRAVNVTGGCIACVPLKSVKVAFVPLVIFPKKSKSTSTEVQVLQLNCGIVRVQFTICLPCEGGGGLVMLNLNPLVGICVLLVVRVTVPNHLNCVPVAFGAGSITGALPIPV